MAPIEQRIREVWPYSNRSVTLELYDCLDEWLLYKSILIFYFTFMREMFFIGFTSSFLKITVEYSWFF